MSETIIRMFEQNGRAFSRRDFDKVLSDFQLPTHIYADGRLLRLTSVESMLDVVSGYRDRLADEGVYRVEKKMISLKKEHSGASVCTLMNVYYADDDTYLGTSMARHWCRTGVDGPFIELTEYLQLPLGLAVDDFWFMNNAA